MIRLKVATVLALACALAFFAPTPTFAALINGSQLSISGDGVVGATFLNFKCDQPGDALVCPGVPAGTGDFAVTSSTGSFLPYNGTLGLVKSISNATQPLNQPFSLPNFITFELNGNITIELTFIPLGNDTLSTNCVGVAHCTPTNPALVTGANPGGLSAFNLDQNSTGTAASFGILGIVHDTLGGTIANLSGIYTAQFDGKSPDQVLTQALGGANSTYSANMALTLIPTTPEPSVLLLSGFGLLGLGLLRRKLR